TPHVDVVERLDCRVERYVAVATARLDRDLVLARRERLLQDRSRRGSVVAAQQVLARQRLPGRDGCVVAALDLDAVEVGRLEVGLRVPARVADQRQLTAGLVGV